MEGKIKIVLLVFTIQKSSVAEIWVTALLFQVVSKCEAISEFGARTINEGGAKGAGNKNWLPQGKCFP